MKSYKLVSAGSSLLPQASIAVTFDRPDDAAAAAVAQAVATALDSPLSLVAPGARPVRIVPPGHDARERDEDARLVRLGRASRLPTPPEAA
jgi:hypothetical protein